MTSDRLQTLFDLLVELPPTAREAAIARECADDHALAARLRALLDADDRAGMNGPWDQSALEHEARAAALASLDAASIADSVDPMIGARIGQYRIESVIGSGGMGTVYRAVRDDTSFQQVVAIKCLKRGMDADQIVARFRAERQILATLEHANIARLLDGGSDARGLPYLVMEFVDGVPPAQFCDTHHLSVSQRLRLFLPIAAAVSYAHQRLVIHRDLKPGNMLVTAAGVPKLLDFGIAKLLLPADSVDLPATEAGMQLVTLRYASPEQVRGEAVTTGADVYSLGVFLFELLTGRSPYSVAQDRGTALVQAVCIDPPIRPGSLAPALRGDLDNILLKALRKDPRERYTSVEQFSEDVRRHLDGLPVLARGDSWSYRSAKFVRRHVAAVAGVTLLIAALATGLVLITRSEARATRRFNDVRRLAHAVVFDYHDAIQDLPGSTPVRKRMVDDALTYLDSLAAEADDPALQRELIDAYVRISSVQGNSYGANLGDTAGALVSARKAVAAASTLLRRDQARASLIAAARAQSAEGELLYSAGDLSLADVRFAAAIALDQRAIALDAHDDEALAQLAQHLRHQGDLYGGAGFQNLGRTADAVERYRRAAAIDEALTGAHPGDEKAQREQYQSLLALASSEASVGNTDDAMTQFRRALTLIDVVSAAHPTNTLDAMERSNVSLRMGMLLMDDRRSTEAVPYIERSLSILQTLAGADPANILYRRNQSVVHNHLARALAGAGRATEALAHNQQSLAIASALSLADGASVELRSDVAISERKLAETEEVLGRGPEAVEHSTRAIAILGAITKDSPDASLVAQLSRAYLARSRAHLLSGHAVQAIDDARQAESRAAALANADSVSVVLRSDLARSQAGLAQALARARKFDEALDAYSHAIATWQALKDHHALTGDDAARADTAALGSALVKHAIASRSAHRQ